MKDPISVLQIGLDKIFDHLLYFVKREFNKKYGLSSPCVTGIDEAIKRTQTSNTGKWGYSIDFEGDFRDLYSNCNEKLLIKSVKKCCELANFHTSTVEYIETLIEIEMNYSFFWQPDGIFKTNNGFSMGDHAVCKGSEIILQVHELYLRNCKNTTYLNMLKNI